MVGRKLEGGTEFSYHRDEGLQKGEKRQGSTEFLVAAEKDLKSEARW